MARGRRSSPARGESTALRENLLSDADALARRGLLDADAVADIRKGQGNVDKANDLVALGALFLTKWDEIENNTAATLEEVKQAGDLGPLLLAALGAREHSVSLAPDAAADQRRRAFTLFFRAYDETRRAVSYLRWHEGDAEHIAPSLYKGRGGRVATKDAGGGGGEGEGTGKGSDGGAGAAEGKEAKGGTGGAGGG